MEVKFPGLADGLGVLRGEGRSHQGASWVFVW